MGGRIGASRQARPTGRRASGGDPRTSAAARAEPRAYPPAWLIAVLFFGAGATTQQQIPYGMHIIIQLSWF